MRTLHSAESFRMAGEPSQPRREGRDTSPPKDMRFVFRPNSNRPLFSGSVAEGTWSPSMLDTDNGKPEPNENRSAPAPTNKKPSNFQQATVENADFESGRYGGEEEDYFDTEVPPRGKASNFSSPRVSVNEYHRPGRYTPPPRPTTWPDDAESRRNTYETWSRTREQKLQRQREQDASERSRAPPSLPPKPIPRAYAKPTTGRVNSNVPLPPPSISGHTVKSDTTGAPSQRGSTWKGDFRESANTGFAWGTPRTEGRKGVREGRERGLGLPQEKGVGRTGKAPASVPQGMVDAMRQQTAETRASAKPDIRENVKPDIENNVRRTKPTRVSSEPAPVNTPENARRAAEPVRMRDSRDGGVNDWLKTAHPGVPKTPLNSQPRIPRAPVNTQPEKPRTPVNSQPGNSRAPGGMAYYTSTPTPQTPLRPMTVEEMQRELTHYEAYTISPTAAENENKISSAEASSSASKKSTWSHPLITQQQLSQEELEILRQRETKDARIIKKLKELGVNQHTQVQRFFQNRIRQERDIRFEWEIVSLWRDFSKDENGKKRTKSIAVCLRRSPKPGVNIARIIEEHRRFRQHQQFIQAQNNQQNIPLGPSSMPPPPQFMQPQKNQQNQPSGPSSMPSPQFQQRPRNPPYGPPPDQFRASQESRPPPRTQSQQSPSDRIYQSPEDVYQGYLNSTAHLKARRPSVSLSLSSSSSSETETSESDISDITEKSYSRWSRPELKRSFHSTRSHFDDTRRPAETPQALPRVAPETVNNRARASDFDGHTPPFMSGGESETSDGDKVHSRHGPNQSPYPRRAAYYGEPISRPSETPEAPPKRTSDTANVRAGPSDFDGPIPPFMSGAR